MTFLHQPPAVVRREYLATAIQGSTGPWTTARAALLYATSGWWASHRNTARKDLRALVRRGLLIANSQPGNRTYTRHGA